MLGAQRRESSVFPRAMKVLEEWRGKQEMGQPGIQCIVGNLGLQAAEGYGQS